MSEREREREREGERGGEREIGREWKNWNQIALHG